MVFTVSFVSRSIESHGSFIRRACGALGFAGVLVAGPSACKPKGRVLRRPLSSTSKLPRVNSPRISRSRSAPAVERRRSSSTRCSIVRPVSRPARRRSSRRRWPRADHGIKGLSILPFDADGAAKARYMLAGTVSTVTPPDKFAISASLTDRPTGLVVAQSAARFVAGRARRGAHEVLQRQSVARARSLGGRLREDRRRRRQARRPTRSTSRRCRPPRCSRTRSRPTTPRSGRGAQGVHSRGGAS